jgi:hypothetical protein
VGRQAFLRLSIIQPLSKLLNDPVFEVRSNAHLAIEMTSEEFPGGRGVLASGLVPVLVEKLKTEEDEIKELILDTLHNCMRIDATPTLDCKAMAVFTGLLNATREGVRARAARNIMDLRYEMCKQSSFFFLCCLFVCLVCCHVVWYWFLSCFMY